MSTTNDDVEVKKEEEVKVEEAPKTLEINVHEDVEAKPVFGGGQ